MTRRQPAAALAAVCAIGLLAGCTPQPEPAPSPTVQFMNEDAAFAAAEKTYLLYVDALNQVDLSDPETFEEVYRWTIGESNTNERKGLSEMHADGWTVDGETQVISFTGIEHVEIGTLVTAIACTDVSSVTLTDASGNSVVPADRPDRYSLELEFVPSASSPTQLLIASSNRIASTDC